MVCGGGTDIRGDMVKHSIRDMNRTNQRLALTALLAGHHISVKAGTLIIMRLNRQLYERVKRVKVEKADKNHASQSCR